MPEAAEERSDHSHIGEHHHDRSPEAGSCSRHTLDLARLQGAVDRIDRIEIGVVAHTVAVLGWDLVGRMAVHIHTAVVLVG